MIYFVTEAYLKNNTPITKNVDVNDVMPYVKSQSDMRIQAILGTYFYDIILTKYNDQTLTADETTLVQKIQPALAWRAAQDAAFGLSYQLKNKGIQQQSGEFSTPVTQSEITFTMDHFDQKAKFYENRLTNWLIDNKDLFSEFTSEDNKDSDLKPLLSDCDKNNSDYNDFMMVI